MEAPLKPCTQLSALIAAAEAFAREALSQHDGSHDWWHVARVRANAVDIAHMEDLPMDRAQVRRHVCVGGYFCARNVRREYNGQLCVVDLPELLERSCPGKGDLTDMTRVTQHASHVEYVEH